MKKFIFLSAEGHTKTPNNEDIENLQVLGFAKGNTSDEAFRNFKKENGFLKNTNFKDIIGLELKAEHQFNFQLNKQ